MRTGRRKGNRGDENEMKKEFTVRKTQNDEEHRRYDRRKRQKI